MPHPSNKRLLVEGQADAAFFTALCRTAGFADQEIWIGPPTSYFQKGDGKGNAFQAFEYAMDDLRSGQVTHLGIVVDADFSTSPKDGFLATYRKIEGIVTKFGYLPPMSFAGANYQGFKFAHPKKLPTIGAWVMPDNFSDGYFEHFCINAANPAESDILSHAKSAVSTLKAPKFPPHFLTKAETATWLAWQESPGQGLNSLIGNKLMDTNSAAFKGLLQWLTSTFQTE
ncbi:MAG: hypothetical protein HY777_15335 [Betaproteobacteria bacterium]|nr:hypothetical protein [Betaproteobacteria bacterium]